MADIEAFSEPGETPLRKSSRGKKRKASYRSPSRGPTQSSQLHVSPSSPVYVLFIDSNGFKKEDLQLTTEGVSLEITNKCPYYAPLYTARGLPSKFLDQIGSSMEIDPRFIDAHAARSSYRPKTALYNATWGHWEYPELVLRDLSRGNRPNERSKKPTIGHDLMCEPVVKPLGRGDLSVIFRRVSIWISYERLLFFLDGVHMQDDGPMWKKLKRHTFVTEPLFGSNRVSLRPWKTQLPQQDELPSIEQCIYAGLLMEHRCNYKETEDAVLKILSMSVHDHWLDLFEALPDPEPGFYRTGDGGLLWQMMQSLEKNMQAFKDGATPRHEGGVWDGLLQRLQRTLNFGTRATFTKQDTAGGNALPPKQTQEDSQKKVRGRDHTGRYVQPERITGLGTDKPT